MPVKSDRPADLLLFAAGLVVAAGVVATSACSHNYYSRAARITATGDTRADAANVRAVRLEVRQGTLRFLPAETDAIAVTVGVGPARGALGEERSCAQPSGSVEVSTERRGGTLLLGLADEPGDECVVEWEIGVPAGILVEATLTVGNIELRGLSNPATLEVGTGDISVDAESASVTAETHTGDVSVRLKDPSYARVDLKTDVGRIELEIEGGRLERRRPAGAGDALSLDGPGRDRIIAKSGIGNVLVVLGVGP